MCVDAHVNILNGRGREANYERMMKHNTLAVLEMGLLYILSNWHVMNNTTIMHRGVEMYPELCT